MCQETQAFVNGLRKRLHRNVNKVEEDNYNWWRDAVGYEAYVRSFGDSNGDGVGDIEGIRERLDYLVELGINTLWVTPFYPSPMADYGYDVADYCGVDQLFGSVDDVEKLTVDAHSKGLRVVIDIVPNHCSSEHKWFKAALGDPTSKYRDYFIWRDPAEDGGPPNNWVGYFGGPAWTLDENSNQYYLHLFLPEQPDLNWRNPDVLEEFDAILRFWLDKGVDGFRIDVAQALLKDEQLRSNPQIAPWDPSDSRWEQWAAFDHVYDVTQSGALEIFKRWRSVVEPYDAVLIGETYVLEPAVLSSLLRGDGLHLGFWFKPMHITWDAAHLREAIREPIEVMADPNMISWVASSHDETRPPTRFGGGDTGRRRSLALSTILFALPGVPFLFQGEELGLTEGLVPSEMRADPVGKDVMDSRDGCRTPMPWNSDVSFGFSTSASTWLPDGGRTEQDTAAFQQSEAGSWLNRYKDLLAVRNISSDLRESPLIWLDGDAGDVICFGRGSLAIMANLSDSPQAGILSGEVLFSTVGRSGAISVTDHLEPDEAVILLRADP